MKKTLFILLAIVAFVSCGSDVPEKKTIETPIKTPVENTAVENEVVKPVKKELKVVEETAKEVVEDVVEEIKEEPKAEEIVFDELPWFAVSPTSDQYIRGEKKVNNHLLRIEPSGAEGFIDFDLSKFKEIESAILELTCVDKGEGEGEITVSCDGKTLIGVLGKFEVGKTYRFPLHSLKSANVQLKVSLKDGNDVLFASSDNKEVSGPRLTVFTK